MMRYFALLVMAAVIAMPGCSVRKEMTEALPSAEMIWPLPPDEPRIKYLYSLESPEDIGIRKGSGTGFWNKLTGKQKERSISRPFGIDTDDERGIIAVTDTDIGALHIFDKTAKKYRLVRNIGDYRLESPIDAVIVGEKIYVTDSVRAAIYVFDMNGKYLGSFGENKLKRPTGIAYDPAKSEIAVVDTTGNCAVLFTTDGTLTGIAGRRGKEEGLFNFPSAVDIDSSGYKYISDTMNFRVAIFDPEWNYAGSFGEAGDKMGKFSKPKGVAVDSEGHVYVVDSLYDVVQIFDRDGTFLLNFGRPGNGPGEFNLPSGIHIDSSDRIYVSDSFNGRIQVFQYLKGTVNEN